MRSHAGRGLNRVSCEYYSSFIFTLALRGMTLSILLTENAKDYRLARTKQLGPAFRTAGHSSTNDSSHTVRDRNFAVSFKSALRHPSSLASGEEVGMILVRNHGRKQAERDTAKGPMRLN